MADQNNNIFPITLLRDHLLPALLTDDLSDITYWAGKDLAREFPLQGISAIVDFFNDAGFGILNIESQKATSQRWILTGSLVERRMSEATKPDFFLEAGFLAQQTEQQIGSSAETQVEFEKDTVILTVLTTEAIHIDE
ncbi:YslB family protein [Weissella coleopterorum]|uniref:YslB family protein n=1 Tax=Weissella coleopterorum TaxID=2714949 RepID=A0A6G8B0S5_9LACO|nr:YslB family protein [Weissella coleopterorum]QIL50908.1 YslB family protein [Weissella coleopterorum]